VVNVDHPLGARVEVGRATASTTTSTTAASTRRCQKRMDVNRVSTGTNRRVRTDSRDRNQS
jgi:hypothetical protein